MSASNGGVFAFAEFLRGDVGDHRGVVGAEARVGEQEREAAPVALDAETLAQARVAAYAAAHGDDAHVFGLCGIESLAHEDIDDGFLEGGADGSMQMWMQMSMFWPSSFSGNM